MFMSPIRSDKYLPEINLLRALKMLKSILTKQSQFTTRVTLASYSLKYPSYGFNNVNKYNISLNFNKAEYPCRKIKDDLAELNETLSHNIEMIKNVIPKRGINMTSFFLDSFATIKYPDPEILNPIYKNLEELIPKIDNPEIIINVLEGLDKVRCAPEVYAPVPANILKLMCSQIITYQNLFSTGNLERIHSIMREFEPENIKEVTELLKSLPKISCKEVSKILDTLKLTALHEKNKKYLEIVDINTDESSYLIKANDKILKVFGCLPQPSDSILNMTNYIKSNHRKINNLLVEDMAIFLEKDQNSDQHKLTEDNIIHKFEGLDQIEGYVNIFAQNEEAFVYDKDSNLLYSKVNAQDKIPSELATVAWSFFNHLDPKNNPKIILMDFTIQEIIGNMLRSYSKEEILKLVDLYNSSTLLEKMKFCAEASEKGCHICNKDIYLKVPRDFISIIGGDPEYPLENRTKFFSLSMIESLINDETFINGLAMIGSYHLIDSIRTLVNGLEHSRENKFPRLDRTTLLKIQAVQREFLPKDPDFMEKLAILETIHHTIDSAFFQKADMEQDINLEKYAGFVEKYEKEITYEKLSENNAEVIISPGKCGGDRLIFGDGDEVDAETSEAPAQNLTDMVKAIKEKAESESVENETFETKRFKLKDRKKDE